MLSVGAYAPRLRIRVNPITPRPLFGGDHEQAPTQLFSHQGIRRSADGRRLFKAKGWSFPNVDGKLLEKDAAAQRAERAEYDDAEHRFGSVKQTFLAAQSARHRTFASALGAAEATFKNDPAVLSELQQFRRTITRRTPATPKPADQKAA